MTGSTAPLGAPTWIDLGTSDLDRAQDFYGKIFGWSFESAGPDYGGYVNATKDGRPVAGLMTNDPKWQMPDGWSTYLHTADAEDTLARAVSAGGTSLVGVMEVPQQGWMAVLTDPSGAPFGLWQPTGHQGFEVTGRPGDPVWFQLTTSAYAKALDFYRGVFGWQTRVEADTPEFRYTTVSFDGNELIGVMDGSALPEGSPSQWSVFFGVPDVDKTIELIVAGGGTVIRAAEDTPYGRLAAVADPTGAGFNLSSLDAPQ